jgi:hypothetical protein
LAASPAPNGDRASYFAYSTATHKCGSAKLDRIEKDIKQQQAEAWLDELRPKGKGTKPR